MEELIRNINMCVREEDIFALERYVGLNELDILVKEIARLNKIIDELEKWNNEKSKGRLERTPYDEVNIKLQELKEEGKSQEIPLFEGTMEQLDNLTILKEEGKE
jgi:hypothetical protein